VKDVYKSSGNFISDQLASHFSSAVTSPRRRTKRRREGGGGGDRRVWNRPGWHSGPVLKASFPQLNPFSDPFIDPPPPLRQANARIFLSSGKVNYMRGWLLARARARARAER